MIGVRFSKQFAEKVLDAIQSGKSIPPPDPGWTGDHMLTLAGILYAAIFSQGPLAHRMAGIDSSVFKKMHPERREAIEESFNRDIHAGIEFVSQLALQVADGNYDQNCEAEVKAIVHEEEGEMNAVPVKGFKGHEDLSD